MKLNKPHYTTACIFTFSKMGIYGSLSIIPFGIIFTILLYYNLDNNLGVMIFNMKDVAPLGMHILGEVGNFEYTHYVLRATLKSNNF